MGAPVDDRPYDLPKPFLQHIEDLRKTIMGCLLCLAVGLVIAVPLTPYVVKVLSFPLQKAGLDTARYLKIIDLTGGLSLAMQIILWSGILFSAPFMLFFVARFVFPGLSRREQQAVQQGLGLAVVLFLAGVATGYLAILPVTIQWMLKLNEWLGIPIEFLRVTDYIAFVLKLLLVFGLSFEYPVVLLVLARLGLVSAAFLIDKRRHVAVILLVLSAIITPSVDPLTQIMLAAPLYVLYEMCIWLARLFERRRVSEAAA